jgi:hypothetical protein
VFCVTQLGRTVRWSGRDMSWAHLVVSGIGVGERDLVVDCHVGIT